MFRLACSQSAVRYRSIDKSQSDSSPASLTPPPSIYCVQSARVLGGAPPAVIVGKWRVSVNDNLPSRCCNVLTWKHTERNYYVYESAASWPGSC
ncbi:hypothetical protein LDENG_00043700 [Lucifuga dentata]|nr:hypothetical protein LDENG_00043700 [Lucifuga dentata]